MIIEHFGGEVKCNTIEELGSVLQMRYGDGVNEYWIYISDETRNPCLAVLVKDNYANLTYFPEDGHPGFQSVGKDTGLDSEVIVMFNCNSPGEEMEISADYVVPFSVAIQAVKEFFAAQIMSKCLEWDEL
jgi:hypothetical protein